MIKYHGTPLTPIVVFKSALKNRNCLIPFVRKDNFELAKGICNKIMIDNGAFSFWTKGIKIDWNDYYKWIYEIYDDIEYFVIPDVIDGTEEENNKLIIDFINIHKGLLEKAIPVWHVAESLERLESLMLDFDYIAFGSSGDYSRLGTDKWHKRMDEIMQIVCNNDGTPKVKIHMLRCLNPKIFINYPFYSGDSTNLARNHSRYNSIQADKTNNVKCSYDGWKIIINRLKNKNSPNTYTWKFLN